MLSRRLLGPLVALGLSVSGLVALPATTPQGAAAHGAIPSAGLVLAKSKALKTKSIRTPTSSVSRPMVGEQFTISGSLGSKAERRAVLQRKVGRTWRSVKRMTVRSGGRYSFTTTQSDTTESWRVVAPKARTKRSGKRLARRESRTLVLTRQAQVASISAPSSARAWRDAAVSATFKPARTGRVVKFQARVNGTWRDIGTAKQSSSGKASLNWQVQHSGEVNVRAIATPHRGAGQKLVQAGTTYSLPKADTAISAHRGGHHEEQPENSYASFGNAIAEGAEWIETDFRLSAPNPVDVDPEVDPTCAGPAGTRFWVLMHDATLTRTTNVAALFPERTNHSVGEFTCQELKTLRVVAADKRKPATPAPSALEAPPTLSEFIAWVAEFETTFDQDRTRLMIEYKGTRPDEFVQLYDAIKERRPEWVDAETADDKAVFISFNYQVAFEPLLNTAWDEVDRTHDGAELGAIIDSTQDPYPVNDPEIATRWLQVHLQYGLVSPTSVAQAKKHVPLLVAWVVHSSAKMQRASALGIDIITTPDLEKARRALHR